MTEAPHALIQGLIEVLPASGETWPIAARAKWLRAAVAIFRLTHTADDDDLTITVTVKGDPNELGPETPTVP